MQPTGAIVYRSAELAKLLKISRRSFERSRVAGEIPKPDKVLGTMPLWTWKSIEKWLEEEGR
jgi:hypothetical protein